MISDPKLGEPNCCGKIGLFQGAESHWIEHEHGREDEDNSLISELGFNRLAQRWGKTGYAAEPISRVQRR